MDGLTWWDFDGMRVLRADYALEDPFELLHAVIREVYNAPESCVYEIIDFSHRTFPAGFIEEYKKFAGEVVAKKQIICAYIGLIPEYFEIVREILDIVGANVTTEFFDTEKAAITWLASFRDCK